MSKTIRSVHEVYFLVRVGQWSEEDLNNWLQQNIDSAYDDVEDIDDYEKDWDIDDGC